MGNQKSPVSNIVQAVWILGMLGVFIYFSGFNGGPLYGLISGQSIRLGTFWTSLYHTSSGFLIAFVIMFIGGWILERIIE